MSVHLRLLGTFRVEVNGEELPKLPDRPMRAALLAYLAVEREVSRERVITDFQKRGESPDKTRHRLNQTLHVLRSDLEAKGVEPDWVSSRGAVIGVSEEVSTDVERFEAAVDSGDDEGALRLYSGAFLEGRDTLPDAPNFEPWVARIRDRLRRLDHEVSARVIDARAAEDDLKGAIRVARRAVQLDPLDDHSHDRLIRLLVDAGRRNEALQQYITYEETIWRAFGDAPWDTTRTLIESLDARPASARELRRRDAAEFEARGPTPGSVVVSWLASEGEADDVEPRTGGLVRRIRDGLARAEGLQVEPISATLYVKEHPADPVSIAQSLNVAWVVDGAVRFDADGLELNVVVVRAGDGKSWSAVFRIESREGEYAVHHDVAQWASATIRGAMEAGVGDSRSERKARMVRVLSLFDVALAGFEDRSEPGFRLAAEKLEEALEIEPNFARAHAKLASVLIAQAQFGFRRPNDVMARALEAANRALEIEPDEPDGYAARGHYHDTFSWDWEAAEADYQHAIRLNPEGFDARTWYADMLTAVGRFRDSRDQIRQAEEAHPLSPAVQFSKGAQHYRAGRHSQAIESMDRALELKPGYVIAMIIRAFARLATGEAELAAGEMEQLRAVAPGPNPLIELTVGLTRAAMGDEKEARACLATIRAVGEKVWVPALVRMTLLAHLGDMDEAGDELRLASEERWGQTIYLAVDPIYDPIRGHAAYREATKLLGL
ncbi:MAG: BTAD domain-containing putative transcriptional regulator, partial [Longimicrobiales bacterium]|nr:BTAD domain-containing putative transcriptional regulator [Longimicrobiales bacterium]